MKVLYKIAVVCALCITMSGCTSSQPTQKEQTTIEIVDQANRTITLDKPAQRIVSGYYIATSTLIGLGQKDKLVGVEMKADERAIYKKAAPEIVALPAMGNKKMFNVEECAKAEPDVVFLPISLKSYVDKLEALQIKVILLEPESMEDFDEAIAIMAKACGAMEKADTYFKYRDELEKRYLHTFADQSRSVYFAGSELLEAASNGMFQGELIQKAAGTNAIQEMEQKKWMKISKETLLKLDPAYLFTEYGGVHPETLYQDAVYASLSAVKNQQVYMFPSKLETWDTPNLSYCLGEIWMHAVLYPNSVSMEEVKKEAIAFYRQFYGIEVNAEDLDI